MEPLARPGTGALLSALATLSRARGGFSFFCCPRSLLGPDERWEVTLDGWYTNAGAHQQVLTDAVAHLGGDRSLPKRWPHLGALLDEVERVLLSVTPDVRDPLVSLDLEEDGSGWTVRIDVENHELWPPEWTAASPEDALRAALAQQHLWVIPVWRWPSTD